MFTFIFCVKHLHLTLILWFNVINLYYWLYLIILYLHILKQRVLKSTWNREIFIAVDIRLLLRLVCDAFSLNENNKAFFFHNANIFMSVSYSRSFSDISGCVQGQLVHYWIHNILAMRKSNSNHYKFWNSYDLKFWNSMATVTCVDQQLLSNIFRNWNYI